MKDSKNISLTPDAWTPVTTTEFVKLYCVKTSQHGVSFRIKKTSDSTEPWTVEPSYTDNGIKKKAQILYTDADGLTGTLFYLQAVNTSCNVEVFLG